jgi:AMP-binding enzyme
MTAKSPFSLSEEFNAASYFVDRHMAESRSDRVAIECEDRRVTYRQLFEQVNQVGNSLKNLGVRPEERVFLLLLDTPEFAASSGMLVPGILIPCHQPCAMAGSALISLMCANGISSELLKAHSLSAPRTLRTRLPPEYLLAIYFDPDRTAPVRSMGNKFAARAHRTLFRVSIGVTLIEVEETDAAKDADVIDK